MLTVDLLICFIDTLFTIGLEVEPVVVIVILVLIVNAYFLPASLQSTIFPGTHVVFSGLPVRIIGSQGRIIVYPAIQHLTILIESIFLAIDGLESGGAAIFCFVCFTTILHVVVTVLSRIIIILILVNNFNPSVGNHNTVSIYIVGIIIVINQFVGSHCATFFGIKPEPVVSRFLPLVFYSIAIFVVVVPGTIFLNPTLSCERGHSTTDS